MKVFAGMPWRLDWAISGLARRVRGCFKAIAALGVEINLCCLGPELRENGFYTTTLPVGMASKGELFSPLINSLAFAYEFSKSVAREEFDVLHCFNTTSFFLTGKEHVFQTVNPTYGFIYEIMADEYPKTRKYQKLLGYYRSIAELEEIEYQKAERIVASSQLIKDNIIRYHNIEEDKIKVIPAGVSAEECNLERKPRQGDMKIVLFPGTMCMVKGFRYLVEAMQRVKKEFPSSVLIVAGRIKQNEKNLIGKLIDDMRARRSIVLAGFLPRKKLSTYYRMADVCCLPSLCEDMSTSILESVANGLPIVATPNTGFPEIDKVGIAVPPKDSEAIADAIIALLSDHELWRRKSERARKVIRKYYWERIAKEFVKVYAGI